MNIDQELRNAADGLLRDLASSVRVPPVAESPQTLDGPEVEYFPQPEVIEYATPSNRRNVVLVAAAAVSLLVLGLVLVPGRDTVDDVTVAGSAPNVGPSAPNVGPSAPTYQWSRAPGDEAIFGKGEQFMEGVVAAGPGLVAVGSDGRNAAVWTSADGYTWARVQSDELVPNGRPPMSMLGVTRGGPGLVAVGYEGTRFGGLAEGARAAVWTSIDGSTWSRVPHDELVFGGEGGQWMKSVTAGGPGLVAVGTDGSGAAVWTSVDGLAWSRVPQDENIFGSTRGQGSGMVGVSTGGPGLVAVGSSVDVGDTTIWTSVDGLVWERVPNENLRPASNSSGSTGTADLKGTLFGVIAAGPGLVAVGSDDEHAVVWVSEDGLTWTEVPNDNEVFGGDQAPFMTMLDVISTDQGLLAVGFGQLSSDSRVGSIAGGSNRLRPSTDPVTSAGAVAWTSIDGLTWARVSLDANADVPAGQWVGSNSVTAFGSSVVAVGAHRFGAAVEAPVWIGTTDQE